MNISFYSLTSLPLETALIRLLEKSFSHGKRAVVLTNSDEQTDAISNSLWTYAQNSFLPHGSHADGYKEHQPIYVTTHLENPNRADVLINISGLNVSSFENFNRCLDIFDANDTAQKDQAKQRWHNYQNQGYKLSYLMQNDQGKWIEESQFI